MRRCAFIVWCSVVLLRVHGISHTVLCMVTAGRRVSYLGETLGSYERERVLGYDGVGLIVVDVDGRSNSSWAVGLIDRVMEKCDGADVEGVPSCVTRQSTRDVAAALVFCEKYASGWVVLVEDDNLLCEGALDELVGTLGTLDRQAIALAKFSPLSTGMSFPVGKVGKYVDYTLGRVNTHPYDVTRVEEWDAGGGVYRHRTSLFQHIGRVSTQEYRNSEEFRKLYASMRDYECGRSML